MPRSRSGQPGSQSEGGGLPAPCCCRPAAPGWAPNLTWITDDLAIGGHVPADRIGTLADSVGVGAVVDCRREDRDDAAHLARHGIRFLHLPTDDHGALRRSDLREGVAFATRATAEGRRVLVHCQHGIGRSATLALCILVERGMEPLEALTLAKDRRELVSPSPAQYECWVDWLRAHPRAESWTVPDFPSFKAVAYRHLLEP
ncbi:dual specificity protein phosphatase family protein [Enterovirga sp.]|jgi:protein-tyrosine phosphatase|uniref:protein-tyrosine phosphatase family protein n=1 Tax=Enterovirga sp. TaxID=2026350 RepID=UPI00262FF775|nr:dual specificity protein phosphatase family protein [Enterovirga sp.]MDB5592756.1 dual specificity protein phosphatase [Enterovirga sp.]